MTDAELEFACKKWQSALAAPVPDRTLRWYFWAYSLTRVRIDFEQALLQGLFGRSRNRQERHEQERWDRQYQERQRQRIEQAKAEQELERQARRDDWPLVRESRKKKPSRETNAPRHLTDVTYRRDYIPVDRAVPSPVEAFFVPYLPALAFALGLDRSDLDMLDDLDVVPIEGFRSSAHSRRRAFFSRHAPSGAPISLAGSR